MAWFLYQFRQFLYELYSTNSNFRTNSDNFYTNCIVRIHTICLRTPQGINYLAIRNDPLAFSYEFVSRIDKKVPSAKTSKSKKIGLPLLPRYVGTRTILYQKILATIHKSGLYDLTHMAYSTMEDVIASSPRDENEHTNVNC